MGVEVGIEGVVQGIGDEGCKWAECYMKEEEIEGYSMEGMLENIAVTGCKSLALYILDC